ncbi:coiled-coil domain-containing protein 113 [Cephus cinctus]|uniref:Cilia- and flagella-associated protein 263 n=1 Tax=Cephus cinctus TaxID=211228 RepID=A0AAJ7FKQ1_CEPCN|nr:coiled-coil domain-containing protein 113 [Cephus cinctus]
MELLKMSSLRRGSVMTIGSRVTFAPQEEESNYDEMSDEELRQSLEQTIRTNRMLQLENDIFERYLTRHDPQCLQTMTQVLESARQRQRLASQIHPISSAMSLSGSVTGFSIPRGTIGSPTISSGPPESIRYTQPIAPTRGIKITLNHRIEMTNKEIDEMKKSLVDLEKLAAKTRMDLRARTEEIELRIRETNEARVELEEKLVKRGVDPLTGKIPAERFMRFMEEWFKAADSMIEKLRLKSSNLIMQIKKAKQELIQREELGKTLHAIDFEQLAIQNQDYVKKIEEKNRYLLEMKKITGRYSLELTNRKQKLKDQFFTVTQIRRGISQKQNQIEKLESLQKTTEHEVNEASKQLAVIIQLIDEYTAPDVLEFVKIQAELREMKKTYKRLDRHRQIQQVAIKSCKKEMKQVATKQVIHEPIRRITQDYI